MATEPASSFVSEVEALIEESGLLVTQACSVVAKRHPGVSDGALRKAFYRSRPPISAAPSTSPATNSISREDLASEVSELLRTGSVSTQKAIKNVARKYTITYKTVENAYYRNVDKSTLAGNSALSVEEDRRLLVAVLALCGMNYPVKPADVEELANHKTSGHKWGRRWLKRKGPRGENILSGARKTKMVNKGRADREQLLESCQRFAEEWDEHLASTHGALSAKAVINVDETLLVAFEDKVEAHRVTRAGSKRVNRVGRRGTTIGSLVAFVNAEGKSLLHVYVLKATVKTDGVVDCPAQLVLRADAAQGSQRGKVPTKYMFSESGRVNERMYATIIQTFCEVWRTDTSLAADSSPSQLFAYVFADQLGAHRQLSTLKYALDRNIFLWSLPKNTSHITQPLDDAPYAQFKKNLVRYVGEFVDDALKADREPQMFKTLLQAAYAAVDAAFSEQAIKHAFEATRLYPWDKEAFLAHCREAVGAEIGETVDEMVTAAANAITAQFAAAKKREEQREAQHVQVVPGLKTFLDDIHDPAELLRLGALHQELLAQQKARQEAEKAKRKRSAEEREQMKEEKAREREHNTCRAEGCKRVWRGGQGWTVCGSCSTWRQCPTHGADEHARRRHMNVCVSTDGLRPRKRARHGKEPEQEE